MVTITVDLSAIVDGERADAADVTVPLTQLKNAIENTLNGVQAFDKLKAAAFATTQISSGTLSPAKMTASVQAESSTADDLATITADNQQVLLLKAYPTHSITLLETGNIDLGGATSVTLSGDQIMMLVCENNVWSLLTGLSGGTAGGASIDDAAACELQIDTGTVADGMGATVDVEIEFPGSGSVVIDTNSFHHPTVNTSRITIPSSQFAGIYEIEGRFRCASGDTGEVELHLYKNGIDLSPVSYVIHYEPTDQYTPYYYVKTRRELVANDYIELHVTNSAGELGIELATLAIHRIGATPS